MTLAALPSASFVIRFEVKSTRQFTRIYGRRKPRLFFVDQPIIRFLLIHARERRMLPVMDGYRRKREEIVSEGHRDTMENLSQYGAIASRQTEFLLSRQ